MAAGYRQALFLKPSSLSSYLNHSIISGIMDVFPNEGACFGLQNRQLILFAQFQASSVFHATDFVGDSNCLSCYR